MISFLMIIQIYISICAPFWHIHQLYQYCWYLLFMVFLLLESKENKQYVFKK